CTASSGSAPAGSLQPPSPSARASRHPRARAPSGKDRGSYWGSPQCEPGAPARILDPSSSDPGDGRKGMKKYVYIVGAGAALLVFAGAWWRVGQVRRPFIREAARRQRIETMIARYTPPEEAIGRRPSPSADAARRQFATWG